MIAHSALLRSLLLSSILALAFGSCNASHRFSGTPYDPALSAPAIAGINWDGSEFRLADQAGRVALVFFGYTFCPDVCPLTLSDMKRLITILGEGADEVAVVFVSVDPERDTPERLAQYIPAFDRRFFGVYMTAQALSDARAGYGVVAEKRYYKPEESAAGYLVDHTARIFLVDQAGRLKLSFAFGTPVEEIAADIRYLLDRP